jgi:hypothetical protein
VVHDAIHAGSSHVTLLSLLESAMAWKPWYIQAAEFNSADERTEFIRGVFGPAKSTSGPGTAAITIASFLAGWGIGSTLTKKKKK